MSYQWYILSAAPEQSLLSVPSSSMNYVRSLSNSLPEQDNQVEIIFS